MFGARLRAFTTCCYLDAGRTIAGSTISRPPCVQVEARVIVTRYSTRPRHLELVHCNTLKPGVLSKCTAFLLPVRASVVGTRLYATDNKQKPRSTNQDTKSQSVLTRLLEEERQQPKALTVGERGVHWYGGQLVRPCSFFSCSSWKGYHLLPYHLCWVWYCCSVTVLRVWRTFLLQQCSTVVLSST